MNIKYIVITTLIIMVALVVDGPISSFMKNSLGLPINS